MIGLLHLPRSALVSAFAVTAFIAAPFAVASGHRQPPPRVLLAQSDGASQPATQAPGPVTPAPEPLPAAPPATALPQPLPVPPPPAAQGEPAATRQADAESFSRAEIEKLVAPIALYPDALLAQLLAATAYPLDVVQAARWIERNRTAVDRRDFKAIDEQRWDESVKALARFPDVIRKLNNDVDWMTDLGEAFVNQPQDVAEAIQDLRQRAEARGALKDSEHQRVVRRQESGRTYVVIEPVNPARIYVPVYDPWNLWWPAPGFVWGGGPWVTWPYYGLLVGVVPAAFYWGWSSGWIYPPYWPGYRGWRPGLAYAGVGPRRWQPNPQRFRPELVSKRSTAAITRYGATSPGGRRIQQNLNAQQRTQRATRELTRAGGRSQQLTRTTQTRQGATRTTTRAQMTRQTRTVTRNRAVGTQTRVVRQQQVRVNRAAAQRSMRVQRSPSMGARSYGGSRPAVRSGASRGGRGAR